MPAFPVAPSCSPIRVISPPSKSDHLSDTSLCSLVHHPTCTSLDTRVVFPQSHLGRGLGRGGDLTSTEYQPSSGHGSKCLVSCGCLSFRLAETLTAALLAPQEGCFPPSILFLGGRLWIEDELKTHVTYLHQSYEKRVLCLGWVPFSGI